MRRKFRTCPECGEQGIVIRELHPDGTACQICHKIVEINLMAKALIIVGLLVIMFADFNHFDTGVIGLLASMCLIAIGAFTHQVCPNLMPLKHYPDRDAG